MTDFNAFGMLSSIGDTFAANRKRQTLADIGDMLTSGNADYNAIASRIAKTGDINTAMQFIKMGQEAQANKQFSDAFNPQPQAAPQAPKPQTLNDLGQPPQAASNEPRGIRNNNPLNLEASPFTQRQPGFTGSDGRFGQFDNQQNGFKAADNLLLGYANRGINTIAGVINRWAPANDGNPVSAYAAAVARQVGVDPNQPINLADPQVRAKLLPAMAQFENGKPVQMASLDPNAVPQNAQPQPQGPQFAQAQPRNGQPISAPMQNPIAGNIGPLIAAVANPRLPQGAREAAKLMLDKALKDSQLTDNQKEYISAKAQDPSIGSFEDWSLRTERYKAGQQDKQAVQAPLVKAVVERLDASAKQADGARKFLASAADLRDQLDTKGGIISGSYADQRLALAKLGKLVGMDDKTINDKIANTEAFSALMGQQVAVLVKSFGSGTSITNQDREYAAKMAGGDIKLDESSIRRIFDILEKVNRGVIDNHNKQVDRFAKQAPAAAGIADSLKVEAPPAYQRRVQQPTVQPQQPRGQSSQQIPRAAVDMLRSNPQLRDQFDAKYGPGSADAIMGNGT